MLFSTPNWFRTKYYVIYPHYVIDFFGHYFWTLLPKISQWTKFWPKSQMKGVSLSTSTANCYYTTWCFNQIVDRFLWSHLGFIHVEIPTFTPINMGHIIWAKFRRCKKQIELIVKWRILWARFSLIGGYVNKLDYDRKKAKNKKIKP